ncbi:MAG: ECF transporter S component [Ruminococcaceae bacterium]|nr:ECF transporter S component [Oscillospiraceae bacterium]
METTKTKASTKALVLGAVLSALVVILQMLGSFIKLGPFSVSLVLIPIVIGAATCGVKISTWLGFLFGVIVLASGDAAAFLAVDALGTIVTVLAKGTLCGLLAGLAYTGTLRLLNRSGYRKINRYVAVLAAALVCPLTNTGVFLLGCLLFFMETITGWAQEAGFGTQTGSYMIFVLVGANFLFEVGLNLLLSPMVVRLLRIRNKEI